MTRIVGGAAGGRRLQVPTGRAVRPTSERTREGLFSTLRSMCGELTGLAFLDLYAGSGAVGLEAASRGAGPVVLVERDPRAAAAVRSNAAALGLPVDIRSADVHRWLDGADGSTYHVVFLDPPYAESVEPDLERLVGIGWLADHAVVVVERSARSRPPQWPAGLVADRSRRYGDSTLWYGRRP